MTGPEGLTVLFIWEVNDRLRGYLVSGLAEVPGLELIFPESADEEALLAAAPRADVMVGWRPTERVLDAARRLKLFINPGVGVQHIVPRFRELERQPPVRLANGHGNTYFTAQHAVALLLALMGRVVPHHGWMADGQWRKGDDDAASIPLRDRHVGLLGYGAINRKVHRFLAGFDVRFSILRRAWPASVRDLPTPADRYGPADLVPFLEAVDVLIAALPLTDDTRDLLGTPELAALGADGLLVNVGRGDVIQAPALFAALQDRVIAGAALDVWYDYRPEPDADGRRYPYPPELRFHTLDNVVLSPHRAASPFSDLRRWDEVIENITRVAAGRDDLLNVVDLERGY